MRNSFISLPRFLLLLAFLSSSYLGICQNQIFRNYDSFLMNEVFHTKNGNVLSENNVKGSPYLDSEFVIGSLITKQNIHYQGIPLRYNIFNDAIEFKNRKGAYQAISNPTVLLKVIIGENTFIYDKKTNKKNAKMGFYQIITSGKFQLLTRYVVKFEKAEQRTGYEEPKPNRFKRSSDKYFLKTANGLPKQISKKKDIELIFRKDHKHIMSYIKKEKINIRKKDHLIKLVHFINQMN